MLVQLAIRNIVLIDRLDLAFGPGLTVLTGETGAGKSILLDAFALALGSRGDGSLVRAGEAQGQVTAVFDLPSDHPARRVAAAQDIAVDGELILRRLQFADGRTRAFVNDEPVSLQAMRAIAHEIVEIHGQHDERALVDSASHRALVDAYGGLRDQVQAVRAAHRLLRAGRDMHASEEARVGRARVEADFLRHAHDELAKLAPTGNEEEWLAERRTLMMQAEKVTADLRDAQEAIAGESSAVAGLAGVMRRLDRRRAQAPALIDPVVKAIDATLLALDGAQAALETALRETAFEPGELERVEERLFALRAAARKHGSTVDQLPALMEKFASELQNLKAGEARLLELKAAADSASDAYHAACEALSKARVTAALRLDKIVAKELPPLKLQGAKFSTDIARDNDTDSPDGYDRLEFRVQTNPGSRPGPLMKVASGGELARFMLALKVVVADRGSAPTLVFDEIDTGIGGSVADAIGQRLARLSSGVQVLAVTHAPQVAARADAHLRIEKAASGKSVVTRLAVLDAEERREEIARMLAGATITEEARAAAGRLLAEAS
ncbi:MAG TPA: DNA repair protein RecN [Beijerinckiaceae bacterium]|jgi:DNA repair protein RecN (Recombination protein N)|nr:DNA repair protein RecN [Beijerinckiaceae bacterium]